MLSYCLKCLKDIKSKNPKFGKNKKNKTMMLLSNCGVCSSKKSKFIKDQEAIGILSILGLKIPLT